ncbi:unnamed protein product [Symbiodinium sp. KB8]|nr:unnamed protein product [Symbiodinium sp. KB8]
MHRNVTIRKTHADGTLPENREPPAKQLEVSWAAACLARASRAMRTKTILDGLSPATSKADMAWKHEAVTEARPESRGSQSRPSSMSGQRPGKAATVSSADTGLPAASKKSTRTIAEVDTTRSGSSARQHQLRRRLSFAADTLEEVACAIREEEPQLDWLQDSWGRILTTMPAADCKSISMRSLQSWVEVYNRWQACGGWNPGHAPAVMDAYQFQELLSVPMPKVLEWIRTFDPAGYMKLQQTRAASEYRKVRVSIPAFLSAAIAMSSTISKKQKIRFLVGVFDENDSRTFELKEFTAMISSFLYGLECIFGIANLSGCSSRQNLGKQIFQRVLDDALSKADSEEQRSKLEAGSAPLPAIENWFLGLGGDPLSVPFALFLERFSVRGLDDDPEIFEHEERKFRLSHTAPVNPPMETAASLDSGFLRRSQIRVVRDLFRYCASSRHFDISHAEAEQVLDTTIDAEFWIAKLWPALEDMETLWQNLGRNGAKFSLASFLKKISPRASARHLRMFQSWLKELDQLEGLRGQVDRTRQLARDHADFVARPVLPLPIRQEMIMDYGKSGNPSQAKDDFIAAMCPSEYRPKEGNPNVDSVVGEFLALQLTREEEVLAQKEALFAYEKAPKATVKSFLKLQVPEASWRLWDRAFDLLDLDGAGLLTRDKLAGSHQIPYEVCNWMCQQMGSMDSADRGSFSFDKGAFMKKMADLSNRCLKLASKAADLLICHLCVVGLCLDNPVEMDVPSCEFLAVPVLKSTDQLVQEVPSEPIWMMPKVAKGFLECLEADVMAGVPSLVFALISMAWMPRLGEDLSLSPFTAVNTLNLGTARCALPTGQSHGGRDRAGSSADRAEVLMTSGRPPLDHRRGSWFAQHGGTRLRFGGVHGTGAAIGQGSTGSSPSETRGRSFAGKGSRLPQSSDVSDALDELLAHARATLSQLDALRGHSMRGHASGSDSKEASQNLRGGKIPAAQARRPARDEKPGFWKPRCQAHLWRGATEDYTNDSLFDSDEDLESTDSEGSESQWDFIHRNMPSQPQPADPQAARRAAMPKFRPFAPGAASARPEASSERSQSKPPSSTTSSPSAGRHVIELVAKTARKNPRQYLQHEKPPFRGTSTVVLGMCVAVAGGKRLFIRATTAAEMPWETIETEFGPLRIREIGVPEGPFVVLIHDKPDAESVRNEWNSLARKLGSASFHVLIPDLHSAPEVLRPGKLTGETLREVFSRTLCSRNRMIPARYHSVIRPKAIVMGSSWGADMAAEVAALDDVVALAMVSPQIGAEHLRSLQNIQGRVIAAAHCPSTVSVFVNLASPAELENVVSFP